MNAKSNSVSPLLRKRLSILTLATRPFLICSTVSRFRSIFCHRL